MTPLILDFDSTLITKETLDVLAARLLEQGCIEAHTQRKLADLTSQAMDGSLSFSQALQARLSLLPFTRDDIEAVAQELSEAITPSFEAHRSWLSDHADEIYVVSGGFLSVIEPVVKRLGLLDDHICANTLHFDAHGRFTALDSANPLAHERGKVEAVARLKLSTLPVVIGDGATDAEIREAGLAQTFHLFTENVRREALLARADKVVACFEPFLYSD